MKSRRCLLPLVALCLTVGPPQLDATHPLPGPHFLDCDVEGRTVRLSWDVLGIDPAVGWRAVLERDGEVIAELAPGDLSYDDVDVPLGRHHYRLAVFGPNGIVESVECEVVVEEGGSVECEVEGQVVTIRWRSPPEILALAFQISRDGETVARLGPDARSFRDEAPPGKHTYVVSTDNRLGAQGAPPDFLIGTCTVVVEGGLGIECKVEGDLVTILWDELPMNVPIDRFEIVRDGNEVAMLPPDATSYREEAPPGEHVYSVFAITLMVDPAVPGGDILVGSCRVLVEGGLPAPRELQCSIAESFPIQVQLFWMNPTEYDSIVVTRNNEPIEILPGDATRFSEFDPGPGRWVYGVHGVRGNQRTEATTCVVELGGPPAENRLSLVNQGVGPAGENLPANASDSLTAVLANGDPVQGWSFGVCFDSEVLTVAFMQPGAATTALNDGAGPTFLVLDVRDRGVTMAAVVDGENPAEVLAPATGHELLEIRYERGPDAALGTPYMVSYCDNLGEPPVDIILVVGGFEVRPETVSGFVVFPAFRFLRGDATNELEVNMTDGIFVLNWLFLGGPTPACLESADVNGSTTINIADPVYLFQALFIGGPRPPHPYPRCGAASLGIGCEASVCND